MIAVVREMCIFMIIAQAVLFFVPGSVYVKYVRVLVGIMMIMGITGPLVGLFMNEEKKQEIRQKLEVLEENLSRQEDGFTVPDNRLEVYGAVEQELKERLSESGSGYKIVNAEIAKDKVVITVEEAEDGAGEKAEDGVGENSGEVKVSEIRIEPVTVLKEEDSIRKEEGTSDGGAKREELKELYGSRIGVEADNIEIVFQ